MNRLSLKHDKKEPAFQSFADEKAADFHLYNIGC